jgi:hypothetical protein
MAGKDGIIIEQNKPCTVQCRCSLTSHVLCTDWLAVVQQYTYGQNRTMQIWHLN